MARQNAWHDIGATLAAADQWIEQCLIADGSMFFGRAIWTAQNVRALVHGFVDRPDTGKQSFVEKLQKQISDVSVDAQHLMAEMLWALMLFPTNTTVEKKRERILDVLTVSKSSLPGSDLVSDLVLRGIGSGGPAFNQHRPRELQYLILLTDDLKRRPQSERQGILRNYDRFMEWVDSLPEQGDRQFRHMLRFFAFPDRVEQISSNGDRRRILEGFGIASETVTRRWSDRQFDEALLKVREQLENENPGAVVDFYKRPFKDRWQPEEREEDEELASEEGAAEAPAVMLEDHRTGPRNVIYYGPPGTGKTFRLQQLFPQYTEQRGELDHALWLQETVARYGWRAVIASVLAQSGGGTKVSTLLQHPWIRAKALQRGRSPSAIRATIWGYLQGHTPEHIRTVKTSARREPFIFEKTQDGIWQLLPDWGDIDGDSAELEAILRAGPAASGDAIRRFRMVTFHPSFSYEDFVRGIRPVVVADDGTTQFRAVDGIFKRICEEAAAHPGKRFALFIDEINRANIAKVFGELITLIETDKRVVRDSKGRLVSGIVVELPGMEGDEVAPEPFGVPENLDIIGTMNTADRSIALLDTALRRRFEFVSVEPDYEVLGNRTVDGVSLGRLLQTTNDRLEFLLDRDHRIGHAYLIRVQNLADLKRAWHNQVIPLLQEFFFDDWSRIASVLRNAPAPPFLKAEELLREHLFGAHEPTALPESRARYHVTSPETWTADSFRAVYESDAAPAEPGEPD